MTQPRNETKGSVLRRLKTISETLVSISMVIVAGTLVYRTFVPSQKAAARGAELRIPVEPVALEGSASIGSINAPAVILAFSDFECPYCGKFSTDVLPSLQEKYIDSGRVLFAFRHMPLATHKDAKPAALAATCAAEQGQFGKYHDLLFANDMSVDADKSLGEALGLEATPTFYFGKVRSDGRVQAVAAAKGARTIDIFRSILNDLLQ